MQLIQRKLHVLIEEKRENVVELQYFSKFFSNIIYIILLEFHKLQMTKKWHRGGNREKKFSACARLSKLDGGAELFYHNALFTPAHPYILLLARPSLLTFWSILNIRSGMQICTAVFLLPRKV